MPRMKRELGHIMLAAGLPSLGQQQQEVTKKAGSSRFFRGVSRSGPITAS